MVSMDPYLIVGLGNPGPQYQNTRHNAGVMVLEELSERTGTRLDVHKKSNCRLASTTLAGRSVLLATPRCYMNLSGNPVRQAAHFFKVPPARTIVLFDDLEIPFGQHRLIFGGGDHGHKGLKSISQTLGTKEYYRAGVGIGRPPGRMAVSAFVLKPFSKQEAQELPIVCANLADDIENLLTSGEL